MLGTTGFLIFIVCSLALVIVGAVAALCAGAIIFSRVAFSLAVALVASQAGMTLVPGGGFLNYVAWAIVVFGIVYLLSTLPRVDMALKFLCTILLSVVIIYVVVSLFGSIIAAIAKTEFAFTTLFEIIVKVICLLFSFVAMFIGKKPHYDSPSNPIMYTLERVLASLMYGFAITFLFLSLQGNWELPILVMLLILVVSTVAAFVADIFLQGKDILGMNEKKEVSMPK